MCQNNTLYTLNLHNAICQVYAIRIKECTMEDASVPSHIPLTHPGGHHKVHWLLASLCLMALSNLDGCLDLACRASLKYQGVNPPGVTLNQ